MRLKISLLLPFSLHPGKVDFLAVELIFLIYVFNKSFQVNRRFITHDNILFTVVKNWYSSSISYAPAHRKCRF